MAFTKTFPYDTGTFVVIEDSTYPELCGKFGSIGCYTGITEDEEFTILVHGYKESWCAECFLEDVRLATDEEVKVHVKE